MITPTHERYIKIMKQTTQFDRKNHYTVLHADTQVITYRVWWAMDSVGPAHYKKWIHTDSSMTGVWQYLIHPTTTCLYPSRENRNFHFQVCAHAIHTHGGIEQPNTYGVADGTVWRIVFSMLLSEYRPIGELNCLC